VPSGLAAITLALLGTARAGDHVLVTDAVYGPTRRFCDDQLKRFGVEVSYYDPLAGAAVEREFRQNTRVVFTESPGSLTFEVQDVPAIAEVAHAKGALVMLDNTWATPLGFPAFARGADVSLHAGTKYVSGHCGLFGVILKPVAKARVDAMLDGLRLFRMGWSWGGFESLIIPANVGRAKRTFPWEPGGPYLRLHVGLESVEDLIADLEAG